jgi:hypothetical protein
LKPDIGNFFIEGKITALLTFGSSFNLQLGLMGYFWEIIQMRESSFKAFGLELCKGLIQ